MISKIRGHALAQGQLTYPPPQERVIRSAERSLGFALPVLLRECYLEIGNGGFGPGSGIIGLQGGSTSDFGNLIETYGTFVRDARVIGEEWLVGLLPFLAWGCNIYSCVSCSNETHPMYIYEHERCFVQVYSLPDFFNLWIEGIDILAIGEFEYSEVEFVNPVSGVKDRFVARKRRK